MNFLKHKGKVEYFTIKYDNIYPNILDAIERKIVVMKFTFPLWYFWLIYNEVLAPRHSGVVRTAASVALTLTERKRKEAIKIIFGYDEMNSECKQKYIADMLEKVWKAGYDFYEKKDLLKLD